MGCSSSSKKAPPVNESPSDPKPSSTPGSAKWPPPHPRPPGCSAAAWQTALLQACGPAVRVGLGELILHWSTEGKLFLSEVPGRVKPPPFQLVVVAQDPVTKEPLPDKQIKAEDICKKLNIIVTSIDLPARPYPWVPSEWAEFPEQVLIYDMSLDLHIVFNDAVGFQLKNFSWLSGLIDSVSVGDIKVKISTRVYLNPATMVAQIAVYGVPEASWDVDINLFPWRYEVPDELTNDFFPWLVEHVLMSITWENPIKAPIHPERVFALMSLGVQAGVEGESQQQKTLDTKEAAEAEKKNYC